MLCYINDNRLFPAKEEVSSCCSQSHCCTQPHIVSHEYQHQEIAEHNLDDVQNCLKTVTWTQHSWPEHKAKSILSLSLLLYLRTTKHLFSNHIFALRGHQNIFSWILIQIGNNNTKYSYVWKTTIFSLYFYLCTVQVRK